MHFLYVPHMNLHNVETGRFYRTGSGSIFGLIEEFPRRFFDKEKLVK